jgi:hypothetical protein
MTTTSRACTRCHKELTDAASMEAGIGPICRKLDNALLAKLIPSNVGRAVELLGSLSLATVAPETTDTLSKVVEAVRAPDAAAREDWRVEVKRVEWALSFPANDEIRAMLTSVVAALGYVGLASLWNGEAATGVAVVTCANIEGLGMRLIITGPKNSAARAAFKTLNGYRFHSKGSVAVVEKAAWSFPVACHAAFRLAVITHYPNNKGLAEAVELAAASVVVPVARASAPVAVPVPVVAPKAKCSIEHAGTMLKVHSPYNPAFIGALKATLSWTDRRWNSTEKVWEVAAVNENVLVGLIVKHYGPTALAAV